LDYRQTNNIAKHFIVWASAYLSNDNRDVIWGGGILTFPSEFARKSFTMYQY